MQRDRGARIKRLFLAAKLVFASRQRLLQEIISLPKDLCHMKNFHWLTLAMAPQNGKSLAPAVIHSAFAPRAEEQSATPG